MKQCYNMGNNKEHSHLKKHIDNELSEQELEIKTSTKRENTAIANNVLLY